MATIESLRESYLVNNATPATTRQSSLLGDLWRACASLRLTVGLLGALMFLVLAGTSAQVEHGIWHVVEEGYFRVWVAKIEWQSLADLVDAFREVGNKINLESSAGFWFPGGYLIGAVMAINLLAAHTLRFKIVARGRELAGGLAAIAGGTALLVWIIVGWLDETQVGPLSTWFTSSLWWGIKLAVAGLALGGAWWLVGARERLRRPEWYLLAVVDGLALAVAAGVWLADWQIPAAGMRIVWMLVQGSAAGLVLLGGCWLVFRQRAGIVLLHAGILLLMGHEFYTGQAAQESQMRISEGQTANYSYDQHHAELAIIDRSPADHDRHIVIPARRLASAARAGQPIDDPQLPFIVRVDEYMPSARLAMASGTSRATQGAGLTISAEAAPPAAGLSSKAIDLPSAYVELLDRKSGSSLGIYLVSASFDSNVAVPGSQLAKFNTQPVTAGQQQYDVTLRFVRQYKPFTVKLVDFRFDRYAGSNMAKNYSSLVQIDDPTIGPREVTISMNNPLRYRGQTYYQQSFESETTTVLQVVQNEGYMVPYASCALVFLGMLWHFGSVLMKFLYRRGKSQEAVTTSDGPWYRPQVLVPLGAAVATVGVFVYALMPMQEPPSEFQLSRLGALPVLHEGRVKPFDTLARTTLQSLSSRQEAATKVPVKSASGKQARAPKLSATQWLLELLAGGKQSLDRPVFMIDNPEVAEQLGLKPRPGFRRYSFNEIDPKIRTLQPAARAASEKLKNDEDPSLFETKAMEIWDKHYSFIVLSNSFTAPSFTSRGDVQQQVEQAIAEAQRQRASGAPLAVVPVDARGQWLSVFDANLLAPMARMNNLPANPATDAWNALLIAYRDNKVADFNSAIAKLEQQSHAYERDLNSADSAEAVAAMKPAERLRMEIVARETWLNGATLFYVAAVMYLVAFVLASLSWFGWQDTVGRAALAIIAVTLVVHTFAIWQRTIISGRPPITNLYDTTICVGWACVMLGVVFEVVYRLGIGSFVASSIGFCTLLLGHQLTQDGGDTFTVLQAVLDTNFWLATHVTSINLGYATTVMAGMLGIVWVVLYQWLGILDKPAEQQLNRMIYGTVCFAILFSFVGTVLGGLWADDSWGRFWGWDPKENGALMVVLWNAIVLHARWGGLIQHRGLAILAIAGNIVTAWSWFGTNGLGVGLHAYGFRDGMAMGLMWFWAFNLAMIGLSLLKFDSHAALASRAA